MVVNLLIAGIASRLYIRRDLCKSMNQTAKLRYITKKRIMNCVTINAVTLENEQKYVSSVNRTQISYVLLYNHNSMYP